MADGKAGRPGAGGNAELPIAVGEMATDGGRAQAKLGRYLAVVKTVGDQPEYPAFSHGQAGLS